jgi:hypothetical protein
LTMAYETKTKPTDADPRAFIDRAEPAQRGADGHVLCDLMERVTGLKPTMWGPSIVGFDSKSYRYASGHSGEICRMGFSPRKGALVLYMAHPPEREALLARLGKHSIGKGCLYIKKLADVDMVVLEALVRASWATDGVAGAN